MNFSEGVYPLKIAFMSISSATNARTMVCSVIPNFPCGHSIGVLRPMGPPYILVSILNSIVYDFSLRLRCAGLNLSSFIIEETPVIKLEDIPQKFFLYAASLSIPSELFSPDWLKLRLTGLNRTQGSWKKLWALTHLERLRVRCVLEAVITVLYGLNTDDMKWILKDCDQPEGKFRETSFYRKLRPNGFWRVDKNKVPELRLTTLVQIALMDLLKFIESYSGNVSQGITAFLSQNNGEGWMLPETLRLADYGLGHDDRAKEHQPVASRLGPRFYDWQLEQDPEESWRECELHARNLLGEDGFQKLMEEIEGEGKDKPEPIAGAVKVKEMGKPIQGRLF